MVFFLRQNLNSFVSNSGFRFFSFFCAVFDSIFRYRTALEDPESHGNFAVVLLSSFFS
ncbi:hypothetical protein LEP1GSC176_3449 [Leptospira kirschneri str. MMD1493]|nr:hypothetical protein LEP1GSC176_3449 [Leptospira kirschneri str. MMD1493]